MKPVILYTPHASALETDPRNPCGQVHEYEAEHVTLYITNHDLYAVEHAFDIAEKVTASDLIKLHAWILANVIPPVIENDEDENA